MVVILTSIVLMVVGIPGIMRSFNQTDLISTHHQHVDLEFEGPRGGRGESHVANSLNGCRPKFYLKHIQVYTPEI